MMNNKFNFLYIEECGFLTYSLICFETYVQTGRIFVNIHILYLYINKLQL